MDNETKIEEKRILMSAKFIRVNRRKSDRVVVMTFESGREVTSAELALLDAFCMDGEDGWLSYSPNKVQAEDVPEQDAEIKGKSQSQRLRNVFYIMHEQQHAQVPFETFYRQEMEKIINHYKSKLEPKH